MLSFMIPTVASISCWIAWVLLPLAPPPPPVDAAGPGPPPGWFGFEPGMYGSYWSDLQESWHVDRESVRRRQGRVRRVRDEAVRGAPNRGLRAARLVDAVGQGWQPFDHPSTDALPRYTVALDGTDVASARLVPEQKGAYMSLKSVVDG